MNIDMLRIAARAQRAAIEEADTAAKAASAAAEATRREAGNIAARRAAAEELPTVTAAIAAAIAAGKTRADLPALGEKIPDWEFSAAQEALQELLGEPFAVRLIPAHREGGMQDGAFSVGPEIWVEW